MLLMLDPRAQLTLQKALARAEAALEQGDACYARVVGEALLKKHIQDPAVWALVEAAWLIQGRSIRGRLRGIIRCRLLPLPKDRHAALHTLADCFVRGGLITPVYQHLAKVAEAFQAWPLTRFAYQGLLRLDPGKPAYTLALGRMYLKLNALEAALDCADTLIATKHYALEGECLAREVAVSQAMRGEASLQAEDSTELLPHKHRGPNDGDSKKGHRPDSQCTSEERPVTDEVHQGVDGLGDREKDLLLGK